MSSDKQRARPVAGSGPEMVTPTSRSVPHRGGSVVDLAAERRRRLLRDLHLGPTVPAPCSGKCRCYHAPLGEWGA
jgi:hypothetical protein